MSRTDRSRDGKEVVITMAAHFLHGWGHRKSLLMSMDFLLEVMERFWN